jgi:signal transduction histidine kinase
MVINEGDSDHGCLFMVLNDPTFVEEGVNMAALGNLDHIGVVLLLVSISLLALYLLRQASRALQAQRRSLVAERLQFELDVAQRTDQLKALAHHLDTAREDERHRLARDLHDELGSLLTSAKLDAARIQSRLADTAPEATDRLHHLVGQLNSSLALGRRIIEDLHPSSLRYLGLLPTLEILTREFSKGTSVAVHTQQEPISLSEEAQLVVYRLVQEALTNVTKYAQAKQVWLTVAREDGSVLISVRDDGIGFDPGQASTSLGLVGMRFRVERQGGRMSVASRPGQGTTIQVTLPERSERSESALSYTESAHSLTPDDPVDRCPSNARGLTMEMSQPSWL